MLHLAILPILPVSYSRRFCLIHTPTSATHLLRRLSSAPFMHLLLPYSNPPLSPTKTKLTPPFPEEYTALVVWSVVETQTGIICACLPSVRHLFKHVFPAGFLSSLKSSHQKGTHTTSGNGTGSHKIWQSRSFKIEKHDDFHELDDRSTTDLKSHSTVLSSAVGVDNDDESGRSRDARGGMV